MTPNAETGTLMNLPASAGAGKDHPPHRRNDQCESVGCTPVEVSPNDGSGTP